VSDPFQHVHVHDVNARANAHVGVHDAYARGRASVRDANENARDGVRANEHVQRREHENERAHFPAD
jgi:hypothetical protein